MRPKEAYVYGGGGVGIIARRVPPSLGQILIKGVGVGDKSYPLPSLLRRLLGSVCGVLLVVLIGRE